MTQERRMTARNYGHSERGRLMGLLFTLLLRSVAAASAVVGKDATVITGRIGRSSQDRFAARLVSVVYLFSLRVGCWLGMRGISHRH